MKCKRVDEMSQLWDAMVARMAGGGVLSTGGVHVMWEGWLEGV